MNTKKAISLRESNDEQHHIGTLIISETDTPQGILERVTRAIEEHFDIEIQDGSFELDVEPVWIGGPQEVFIDKDMDGESIGITIERTWFY